MNLTKIGRVLMLVAALSISMGALAQGKPRWVSKGVKELNAKRISDTYTFQMFQEESSEEGILTIDRFRPLENYVASVYGVNPYTIDLDSIEASGTSPKLYTLTFDNGGRPHTVYAQEVDTYKRLEDYVDNTFKMNYYQLFAVTNPDVNTPAFDKFTISRRYNAGKATAMSLIPGLGQLYKGQTVKGALFMSVDVALFGLLAFSEIQRHHYKDKQNSDHSPLWHNQINTYKELSIFCAIAAPALYLYNIFDAALCPVAPHVEISRNNAPAANLTFVPTYDPRFMSFGVGMNVTF